MGFPWTVSNVVTSSVVTVRIKTVIRVRSLDLSETLWLSAKSNDLSQVHTTGAEKDLRKHCQLFLRNALMLMSPTVTMWGASRTIVSVVKTKVTSLICLFL